MHTGLLIEYDEIIKWNIEYDEIIKTCSERVKFLVLETRDLI
jgi:hypothetical protein